MFDVVHIIESGGLLLIGLIVFAESGLLVGFFLPGDTLLFTAGFFAGQGKLSLIWLILIIVLAAIIGDNVGYEIGKRAGRRVFRKKDGILFRHEHIAKAENFYEKHGAKTMILARFIPIIRTFAPLVAGVGKMPRRRFIMFDIIGATFWGSGVTLLGVWLGSKIPNIDKYLLPIILLAMALSFGPSLYHMFGDKDVRAKIIAFLKRHWFRTTSNK